MGDDRQAAAARLAEITGSTGEAVTVRAPDAPSLWRRARGYVAAAAVGASALAGAGQAEAFGRDALERQGATPGVHSLDTPQGGDAEIYHPVDIAGISAAMAAADEMPQDRFEATYPGRRFNEMSMDEGTKGVGLHIEGEAKGFFDLSRQTCAVEYNPGYMDGGGQLDRGGKAAYAQHLGAAICLHQALTEQPASDLQARVAQGVLAEALAERSGGASLEAVDRGLDTRAVNLMSVGGVDHATIMPEDTERELSLRKAGAVMHLADVVVDQDPVDTGPMDYKQLVDYADARTQDALDLAERSGLKGLAHWDAVSLSEAGDAGVETVRDAAMKSFEPDSKAYRMIADTQAERDDRAAEKALFGYADVVSADQKPGPAQTMSEEQLFGYADTVAGSAERSDRAAEKALFGYADVVAADQKPGPAQTMSEEQLFGYADTVAGDASDREAGNRPNGSGPDLRGAETREINLEQETREIDLKAPRTVGIDLTPQETASVDLKGEERSGAHASLPRELVQPAAQSELVKMASEGAARPDPKSEPELARHLVETVNPKNPATYDPTHAKQLYTEAPGWFPAMASAKEGQVEARAARMVKRDYGVALKGAEQQGPEVKERLAGFAEKMPQLQDVLTRHEETQKATPRASRRGADMER